MYSADESVTSTRTKTISLTTYLFTRLHQLGVRSLHGVPGDYNLTALDHVAPSGLTWIGNCNELNAGYAADGYSRIKGVGALITAFGVGELSAINAIGGAYAERAAVVHIVGTPPRGAAKAGLCLHHSLGNGDFRVFARMAKMVTVAQAELGNERTATSEVDRVLRECVSQSRPVYIELPTDMVNVPVEAARLDTPIDPDSEKPCPAARRKQDEAEEEVIRRLVERISKSTQPFLIIDGFVARWSVFPQVEQLVRVLGWPTTSTPFGKSCIDETLPNFHGIYAGIAGKSIYKPWVDACDLVLRFGGLGSDVNTYGYSTLPPAKATIDLQRDHVVFGDNGDIRHGIQIQSLLRKLLRRVTEEANSTREGAAKIPKMDPYPTHLGDPRAELAALPTPHSGAPIQQDDFWRRISRFFREGDVILTETGTSSVGSRDFVLPRHARLINSSIWLSIGYMLPAAQGAAMAVREIRNEQEQERKQSSVTQESDGGGGAISISRTSDMLPSAANSALPRPTRTILFQGDGSFQMTAQELGTLIRHRLDLTFFLINNDGYTIERFIHGMKAHYNDVARWRYLSAPAFFGGCGAGGSVESADIVINGTSTSASSSSSSSTNSVNETDTEGTRRRCCCSSRTCTPYRIQTHRARTWGELWDILAKEEVRSGKGLCMIEVFMGREDGPESLKKLVRNVKRRNSGVSDGDENGDHDHGDDEDKIDDNNNNNNNSSTSSWVCNGEEAVGLEAGLS